ncbi:hypothetical protein CDAR_98921 [Caerostris darwini]|uniref:Uncharacterized protein n=1 Tax=Caerostris darwini TaxID=1538125 RepID=A0AAV4Q424_9ARAC|nr:hypothetical protein CDAR_98921 [Caerostris darwini]
MQMDARDRLQGVLPKSGRRLHSSIDLTKWGEWMNPSHHCVAIKGRTELFIICWASFEVANLIRDLRRCPAALLNSTLLYHVETTLTVTTLVFHCKFFILIRKICECLSEMRPLTPEQTSRKQPLPKPLIPRSIRSVKRPIP